MDKNAEEYAKEMKEISPAEFFEKNRHFLGYENPVKSLLTVIKEAIDNWKKRCKELEKEEKALEKKKTRPREDRPEQGGQGVVKGSEGKGQKSM